ncbi:MAG: hydrogenase expression/formation protein HypE [Verrucomicrobia bacterium]|nr:hydrogenase expression/formation protein HypE [Verrucomicrobiota bacterium]MBU4246986.1 hydrogenase expression/formation protein HypE [Verrucomicrobiota bacterium]MBU4291761.1 hydrogenase expression/formation protein HypE [Verrucomicrobiota bacterium]MBU4498282.1 hydrogenase expression/formation protein HypE [Verrucomicrobiota bacterium]MCG2681589.1 hydrogenase expression/formation protein HypE [Kiritimatiellia bacterium]
MSDFNSNDIILLSHGGGGGRTQALIRNIILRRLGNPTLDRLDDSACLSIPESELAFTTDSYVVNPIFFPGGDIGKLAACGTINDLVMQGAEPRYLSLGLILEEGLPLRDLDQVIQSLAEVTAQTGVRVVTGDTKVVERGKGNGIFINTSGIGVRLPGTDVHVSNARPGDAVIITGTLGDHGAAVMSRRLNLETDLASDVAPLWTLIAPLLRLPAIHCLRDPTRGGVAAAVCDLANSSHVGIRLKELALPVRNEVRGICQLLGLDPLNAANEGKAIIVCPETETDRALQLLRSHPLGREAAVIGIVTAESAGLAVLETAAGGERIIHLPLGEDLPRIC